MEPLWKRTHYNPPDNPRQQYDESASCLPTVRNANDVSANTSNDIKLELIGQSGVNAFHVLIYVRLIDGPEYVSCSTKVARYTLHVIRTFVQTYENIRYSKSHSL